jgi:hypothetical protein
MTVCKTVGAAPDHLDVSELTGRQKDALVLLPDTLTRVDDQEVAGFRAGAQELRVHASREGIPVDIVVPDGARAGRYSEHAADWVLPLILGVPAAAVAQLIANEVQQRIDAWRQQGRTRMPTLRYREVVIDKTAQRATLRELEGPADEVADWVRRRAIETSGDSEEGEWRWPERE